MSRDWKPGDVAMVTVGGRSGIGVRGNASWSVALDGYTNTVGDDLRVSARPLVVIDPEDRDQVERLDRLQGEAYRSRGIELYIEPVDFDVMQAALREFATPTPPKPDEPTGLGAVVEDTEGARWVRARSDLPGLLGVLWENAVTLSHRNYGDIGVVRVLSAGLAS